MPLFLWKGKQLQRGQAACLNSHSYFAAESRLLPPSCVHPSAFLWGVFVQDDRDFGFLGLTSSLAT